MRSRIPFARLVAPALAGVLAGVPAARAQVDWSGLNTPAHGTVWEVGQAVHFTYAIFDADRTQTPGRGAGLGARVYWRNADTRPAWSSAAMHYDSELQATLGIDDVFAADVPFESFDNASRVEYFTVALDSLAVPMAADTTLQDANQQPPNYVFSFGQATLSHEVAIHFSVCLARNPANEVTVRVLDPLRYSETTTSLFRVDPTEAPDLWEGDVVLPSGAAQSVYYYLRKDGRPEATDGWGYEVGRPFTMTRGIYAQSPGTLGWQGAPVACRVPETLDQPVRVHFSVCVPDADASEGVCVTGPSPALGGAGVALLRLQGMAPNLFEGDVEFPAGDPALAQYVFRRTGCTVREDRFMGAHPLTHRFLYLGRVASPFVAPSKLWADAGANPCGPPTGVESAPWTAVKRIYR